MKISKKISVSTEILSHFLCGKCERWWTIGDAPKDSSKCYCPWCGEEQKIKSKKAKKRYKVK